MKNRIQLFFLLAFTAILAITAIGFAIYEFKDKNATKNSNSVSVKNDAKKNKRLAIERNKDKKSDNLTQQTFASIVDIMQSKQENPELSDKEMKDYLRQKITKIDIFSYSFTQDDIKISKGNNTKQALEQYFTEVYALLPKQTVFAGTLDVSALESLEKDKLQEEVAKITVTDTESFNRMLAMTIPEDAERIHETYLKLVNLDVIFFETSKQMERDPLKAKKIFERIQEELPELQWVLDSELARIGKGYGIEFEVVN